MRVRLFELRLLAAALTALWAIAGGLVLLWYRPGGPIDLLVGILATPPVLVGLAAVVWPPAVRGDRPFAAVVWLGLGAALLLIPATGDLLNQILARGAQTLLPSPEAAYPWFLALAGTSLFMGLGIARRVLGHTSMRRHRLALASAIGLLTTVLGSSLFAGAAIANDLALRNQPAQASRFGPTHGAQPPAGCGGPIAVPRTAVVDLHLQGEVDGHPIGSADLHGARSGTDVRWSANVATRATFGLFGLVRVGERAWTRTPGTDWHASGNAAGVGPTLDTLVLATALSPGNRTAAEDRGLEFIEGARARHCRIAIDGALFGAAFPQVDWMASNIDLHRWRGQLDYWLFADDEVGQVVATVNGEALSIGYTGLQATFSATLTATDRNTPVHIEVPVP